MEFLHELDLSESSSLPLCCHVNTTTLTIGYEYSSLIYQYLNAKEYCMCLHFDVETYLCGLVMALTNHYSTGGFDFESLGRNVLWPQPYKHDHLSIGS